jgi:hypothetical protein
VEAETSPLSKRSVVYLYCDINEREVQNPANLLAAIFRQLISSGGGAISLEAGEALRNRVITSHAPLSTQGWIDFFAKYLAQDYELFIIIDAIDELLSPQAFAKCLSALIEAVPGVKLLVFSRPLPTVAWPVEGSDETVVEIDSHVADITAYVRQRLQEDSAVKFALTDPIRDQIVTNLVTQQGSYR